MTQLSSLVGPERAVATVAVAPRLRLEFVDGMRAVAALAVVFIHVFYEPSQGGYSQRWMYWLGTSYTRIPVDIFIVLSGFCLMLPIARRGDGVASWSEWFARRGLRILPACYAAVLLSWLLSKLVINPLAHHLDSYVAGEVPDGVLIYYALQLHDVFISETLQSIHNPPLWSIAVECKIYLFMPLVLASLRRLGSAKTLLWTSVFGLGLQHWFAEPIGSASPYYLALFCMGGIAARASAQRSVGRYWGVASALSALLLLALIGVKKSAFYHAHSPYFSMLVGAMTALFVGAGMRSLETSPGSLLVRLLSWRPLVTIGAFSYSLYLIHNPLLRIVHLAIESVVRLPPEAMFGVLLLTMPLYVGAAYLFHLIFERPLTGARLDVLVARLRPTRLVEPSN